MTYFVVLKGLVSDFVAQEDNEYVVTIFFHPTRAVHSSRCRTRGFASQGPHGPDMKS